MTVFEMKKLLKGLPNDLSVVMFSGETLAEVCLEKSDVIKVFEEDMPDEYEEMLLLLPCSCGLFDDEEYEDEIELGDINSQPELN